MKEAQTFFYIPILRTKDPITHALVPAEGRMVPRTSYWMRRVRDGDGKEGTPPSAPAQAEAVTQKQKHKAPAALVAKDKE